LGVIHEPHFLLSKQFPQLLFLLLFNLSFARLMQLRILKSSLALKQISKLFAVSAYRVAEPAFNE
jgi:hypothetical protein